MFIHIKRLLQAFNSGHITEQELSYYLSDYPEWSARS